MTRLAMALILLLIPAMAQAQVPEPDGFHGEPYRSEVPATLQGAQVITPAKARTLRAQGVPFLDTMPRKTRPKGLPPGTIWTAPPHLTIPGAVWLYDTGYDRIAPAEQQRLEQGLIAATHGDKAAPVVIFCKSDCWMSWNAAKRAVGLGYTGVLWFPLGADGWTQAGGTLVPANVSDP
ncbi:PQQ-dependent catabolism-associated CXXCW motif protein [Paracoccus shanxieyensis]|uniref:PQQ-dependent catabolism-associated CXXCW motif protein n=1 Tax=Paracoccus shanxieyensis TaxID=2675752 RepID=A0A6L6J6J8_9RHOB|nr:PQQ-dependent catabolism-associated CXXCW motif protein [Paracoccus shanxieyensis]MTH66417.1 PQQ-dependent catabolism-associated CXXCW motif protein [Paracoccus shanxieyensis]MTH89648.1 PQQ-dependent catabolism-associated CXXCW motif protein [Paracoccus shanxieyensis]